MKNKKVKKNIQFLILVLIILGLAFSVFAYTKNELRFKYFNDLGIAEKNSVEKERYFNLAWNQKPEWALIEKSNKLDILYQEKKYEELKKKIGEVKKNECSLEKKEISEFCENIFYLSGLVEYQLGQKDKKKEEEFNQKAIFEFQKTLAVNSKNIWAKENIEFLLKRQEELKKQKEEQKRKQGKGQKKKDDKNQNGKSEENDKQDQKNGKGKKDKEKQNGKKGEGKDDQQKDQKGKSGKENNKNKESRSKNQNNQNGGKSRLPSQIQKALKNEQKKLEQGEKNQKGFARTRSKAEQNRQQNQDPFSAFQNDPFFQDFFGNDPFFNQAFRNSKKNLRKDLGGGENEKDW